MIKPLENILIVDFSQFLSGPSCTLRLADLGAEVIKIEKPETGDICRNLYVSNLIIDGQSSLFHAINRNKKSFKSDLKDAKDLEQVKKLIAVADVVVHNFKPGVMERLGLDYESVKGIKPNIIYASISGYGDKGEWVAEPGQDLLLQAVSGLSWLSGATTDGPVPMGASVVDSIAGTYLAQGVLAALYQKNEHGVGSEVQVNMLESSLEYQFEVFTSFLNDGQTLPNRSDVNAANAYLAAPYGIYKTSDGFIALAMANIVNLGKLINNTAIQEFSEPSDWFDKRDEIKTHLAKHLVENATQYWLNILEPADIWCAEVLDYEALRKSEAYQVLDMEQKVINVNGTSIYTTRCPIKINGEVLKYTPAAPELGEHNEQIIQKYNL